MATDLDRLRSWMILNNFGNKAMSHALGYAHDCITNVMNGRVGINHSLRQRFGRKFGRTALNSVFQDHAVPQALSEYGNWQEHGKAHGKVSLEIRKGRMPHSSALKCHGCDKQAQLYHHESYCEGNRLCVVPLCRTCHRQHHTGKRPLIFGVVPTFVGIIRIAIATAPEPQP